MKKQKIYIPKKIIEEINKLIVDLYNKEKLSDICVYLIFIRGIFIHEESKVNQNTLEEIDKALYSYSKKQDNAILKRSKKNLARSGFIGSIPLDVMCIICG